MKRDQIRKMVFAAVFVALGFFLPFLTGQIPNVGSALSPMHIPVLLCGFVCGWKWGLVVGVLTPLLRSVTLGMPPMMPTAVAMAFELAAYGCASGLLYRMLPKKPLQVYVALITSMLVGRAVWGIAAFCLYTALGRAFTWEIFAAGAFVNAVPGIILHIVVIPPIVLAMRKAKFLSEE